ncbi:MAG: hypothetical protein NC311_01035 [Muribaculaceae bacterium]|nr:hypothetical protein [Muribaculaceae bacterium]
MSRQIIYRNGNESQHSTFVGAPCEITVDTTNWTLRIHDGVTPGGHTLARADELTVSSPIPDGADYVIETQLPTADNNYTWYRKYKSGWVEQGGITVFDSMTTLPITMSDVNYTITITAASGIGGSGVWTEQRTTTSFVARGQNYGGGFIPSSNRLFWFVSGTVD